MLGAIIGDIVGSYYEVLEINAKKNREDKKRPYEERIKVLDKNVPLFTEECTYTDDTVLTLALSSSIINNISYEESLRSFGTAEMNLGVDKYGRRRFGSGFVKWLQNTKEGNSYGNGGAMRISPIGFYYDNLETILEQSHLATIPSHNNEEAIIGAQAVSTCIYLARKGYSKKDIKKIIEFYFDYDLDLDLEELQHNYIFSARTKESIPEAIFCFLESESFEDALRKSLSIGGDADTIAAITGAISESFYGIPESFKEKALSYLPEKYQVIVARFYEEVELQRALREVGIDNQEFINFMKSRTKRYDFKTDAPWGCFPQVDSNGILENIKLLVPKIIDEKTLLINIHEYTHAYELYPLIGKIYNEDVSKSESLARTNEEKYLAKKKLYSE